MAQPRMLDMRIPVHRADETGAPTVRRLGHRTDQRCLLDIPSKHDHILAVLHVGSDADR
jgi:hypothetical protein